MSNKVLLDKICKLLRYDILTSTTAAGSGHPTSSLSAVELMATLFFAGFLCYDLNDPKNLANDRVIFSKGHASPLLYALYHVAGVLSLDELLTLRTFNSTLEGHPTPRFKFVDVATGSLGQGLSVGVGMALGLKKKFEILNPKSPLRSTSFEGQAETNPNFQNSNVQNVSNFDIRFSDLKQKLPKVFVLLGDSEMAEGQVWEALEIASYYKLNNLVGILDVSRLGQRGETMVGWNLEIYQKRIESFGWETIVVEDGNDLEKVYDAYHTVFGGQLSVVSKNKENTDNRQPKTDKPIMIIAKTVKGKGISFLEDKEGWHGKALNNDELKKALEELGTVDLNVRGKIERSPILDNSYSILGDNQKKNNFPISNIKYQISDLTSTREAYGDALVEIGKENPEVVVLDAEVANSTYENKFQKEFPDRFFEMFIAEENMMSVALGLSKTGYIPYVGTFAAFLTQTFDQIRMAQYSDANLKIVGSHAGVSIGQDGASQMGLEDLAMMRSILRSVVFYPSDAVSTFKLTQLMAKEKGIFYLRTTREKTPVLYSQDENFIIGGSKVHKVHKVIKFVKSKVLILSAGITLFEALKAQKILAEENIECTVLDCYSIKPLDETTIRQLSASSNLTLVVEDHYPYGGLGEAVSSVLSNKSVIRNPQFNNLKFLHLSVNKLPRSGKPEELLNYEEIDSASIVKKIKEML